jgi:EAL and modified HD-GYP domain-containing signal transduction protein
VNAIKQDAVEVIDHISIARQPIVDAHKNIHAYELFNRSRAGSRHTVASDTALALNAIANRGTPFSIAHSDLFVHVLHEGLGGSHWDFLDPKKVVACVPPVANHDPQRIAEVAVALAGLRKRGFRLSFQHAVVAPVYRAWQPLADFVKLDLAALATRQLAPLLAAIQARTPACAIGMKVESAEQFAYLQKIGVARFQGYWFSAPEVLKPRVLSPAEAGALELFNLVSQSAPLNAVEEALKKDAAMGVNLLRIINSAGLGLSQKVSSLRQAVMLMGYEKLGKWAALVLTTASFQGSSLVKSSAIARGRMMELLSHEDAAQLDPGRAFLIGLLSQVDRLLGCQMHSALAQLSLSDEVVDVLLGGSGVYADMLQLTMACESEHDADFARAFGKLHFTLRQINMAHLEALAWTDATLESAY